MTLLLYKVSRSKVMGTWQQNAPLQLLYLLISINNEPPDMSSSTNITPETIFNFDCFL
jgi:hypothetical protein